MIILGIIAICLVAVGLLYWLFMSSYSQVFGDFPYKVDIKEKIIALTFDDGPNEPYTSEVLSYLREKNIPATFFLVGKCIERYPELIKQIQNDGHVIGNHSVSHAVHKYFTSLSFKNEILSNQKIIEKHIGKKPALFRPPWLFHQPFLLQTVRRLGMTPVSGVFCHPMEVLQSSGRPTAEQIAAHVQKVAKPGSIIIFHDGFDARGGDRHATAGAVRQVINQLEQDGYRFVTVDKLLNVPAYQA